MKKQGLLRQTDIQVILGASALAAIAILALVYLKPPSLASESHIFFQIAPLLHAILNGTSAIFICLGLFFIFKKQVFAHKLSMGTALGVSSLFLISYLSYHWGYGHSVYTGLGWLRLLYFFILISHIILSIFALPLILITVWMALREKLETHRHIARWTAPIWLYVSVTGVLVYLLN